MRHNACKTKKGDYNEHRVIKMLQRFRESCRRFMYGRYGTDQFNTALMVGAIALSVLSGILSLFLGSSRVYALILWPIFSFLTYAMIGLAVFRMFSRNVYRRQRENRRWKNFCLRITDRNNRYFRCPSCKQTMRVPRHRGKVNIRCPKCGEKFTRNT